MPGYANPNQPAVLSNPFAPGSATPFSVTSSGPERFAGRNAPQAGARPLNSDISGISQFARPTAISDAVNQIPSSTLPFTPPDLTSLIQGMSGTQSNFEAAALPLLAQILGMQGQRLDAVSAPFGAEMALRGDLLSLLQGQSNSLLEQLVEGSRPRSGAFLFR